MIQKNIEGKTQRGAKNPGSTAFKKESVKVQSGHGSVTTHYAQTFQKDFVPSEPSPSGSEWLPELKLRNSLASLYTTLEDCTVS